MATARGIDGPVLVHRARAVAVGLTLAMTLATGMSVTAAQEYHTYDISGSTGDSEGSVVACAPSGAVLVAWEEGSGEIFTRLLAGELHDPVDHGPGHDPALCCRDGEFVLAFADIAAVRVRQGDGLSWGPLAAIVGGSREVTRPDVAPVPSGAAAEFYLVWQENRTQVYFSQRVLGGWSTGELVVIATPAIGDAAPQVGPTRVGSAIVPRAYYYDSVARLRYRERVDSAWGDWHGIPGPNFALDGDVAWDSALLHHVVSTEPNHPCPCNHLYYARELASGGWADVEVLDVVLDEYNWPQYPSISMDTEDVPHVFWYQVFHDANQQLSGEQMFHYAREGSAWIDHSEVLSDTAGIWNALAIDPQNRPVFAWAEEQVRARDIMLSRFETSASVPDAPGAWGLRLTASPNPAAGPITFTITRPHPSDAWLDVLDAAGRRVWGTRVGAHAAGAATTIRWNRRDRRGGRVPAGVYHARVVSVGGHATTRLLLID